MDDDAPSLPSADEVKQVLVIRRDLRMRRGKEIAQGAHASSGWLARAVVAALDPATGTATVQLDPVAVAWLTTSWRKVTLQVPGEAELVALDEAARTRGLRTCLVRDSGRTEFAGVPTLTALAIGPDLAEVIDEVTGHLALY
jgi:PTH2 family peptidyl-tRNA hydrolase